MITEYVLFDLPQGMSREAVLNGMRAVAPRWQAEPDLFRKTFLYDPSAGVTGAFYLWKSREAAERAHDERWRQGVRDKFGSEPVIRYFETPLIVDNVIGGVVEA